MILVLLEIHSLQMLSTIIQDACQITMLHVFRSQLSLLIYMVYMLNSITHTNNDALLIIYLKLIAGKLILLFLLLQVFI